MILFFREYKSLFYTLKEIQNSNVSGSTTSGLLKKISYYEFLGTLYLLKNILPSLTGLSKTFHTGGLNFFRISLAINRCKSKIFEVAKYYRVIQQLKDDLNRRLKEVNIILKESQEIHITNLVEKYVQNQNRCARLLKQGFLREHAKFLSFGIFDIASLRMSSSPSFCVCGINEISFSAEHFFPEKSVEIIMTE